MTSIEVLYSVEDHANDLRRNTMLSVVSFNQRASISDPLLKSIKIEPSVEKTMFRFHVKSSTKAHFAIALFVIIVIIVGVLTVNLTSPRRKEICEFTFRRTIGNPRSFNSRPQSVAIGYFNNDTQLDFVIANTGTDTINVFLGYDSETFGDQMTYSTGYGSRPYSVAVGNFDNNNGIDIAVANFGTNSIGIFFGLNNGRFIMRNSFSTGSSRPLFIAVSDFNNDTQLDIALVNYGTNSLSIFKGSGDGNFSHKITYSTGFDSLPNSLAIGDLNNDLLLDIVVANYGTDNIGIFYGKRNGTFEDQKIYSTGFKSNPSSVVIADVNKDNQLDIIVAKSHTSNIGIFFGHASGMFITQVTYSTGVNSHPEFIAIGDFNRDYQLDIIVTDSSNDKVYILPNHGNGTFPEVTSYSTGFGSDPYAMAIGDFNKDNISDCLITNRDLNNALVLIGYQSQRSVNYTTYFTGQDSGPKSVAIGDLNNDNILDIVVAYAATHTLSIYFGYGDGRFIQASTLSIGNDSRPWTVDLGDFNNDHQLDIVVASVRISKIHIFLGYDNGNFSYMSTFSFGNTSSEPALALYDLNNDTCLDIIYTNNLVSNIIILLGYCNGTFLDMEPLNLANNSDPISIAVGDLNNDNHLDIVVASFTGESISIVLGNRNGTFQTAVTYDTQIRLDAYAIALADFNNDKQLDMALAVPYNSWITILFGNGNGTFRKPTNIPLTNGRYPIAIAVDDLNNDNQLDIVVSDFASNDVTILFGNNNGTFPIQTTYSTGSETNPFAIKIGDFNNDKKLDIVVANYAGDTIGILISYASATFTVENSYSTGSGPRPYSLMISDFNNDNRLDMVVVNSASNNIGIRFGYDNGSFGIETTYSTGSSSFPQYVNIGDFNKDNQSDIVVTNSQNDSISVFFGYNNGSFGKQMTYSTGLLSSPNSIVIGDFNNDKWLDLVVANENSDNIGLFYGFNYSAFLDQQVYYTGTITIPYAVCVEDFNNDSRSDIAVVNYGTGDISIYFGHDNGTFTEYTWFSTGSDSQPVSVSSNDFNNDHCQDLVVANKNTNSIGILLGYCNGSFSTIMIYSTGNDSKPSSLAVGDVNNDGQLDIITAHGGTDSVGILLGNSNGTFSNVTIYPTGVDSTLRSVTLGDLNKDNYLDIVISDSAQNNVGIYFGRGNGSFAPIRTYFTGSKSSPYSVILADFNNDNHLDMAAGCADSNSVSIFYGLGNGNFTDRVDYSTGSTSYPAFIISSDFNEDNQTDIAVICNGNNAIAILFGLGYGKFLMGKKYSTGGSTFPLSIAAGHFNSDTRLDIVVANLQNFGVFIANENEYFATVIPIVTGSNSRPHSVAVDDFNNDNRSDIVVANYGTDNIGIIFAYDTGNYSKLITYSTGVGSGPYAVTIADFNDDKQLDIAVVNSNTHNISIFQGYGNETFTLISSYSTGIDSFPHAIVVSDFNNDKRKDIAVANSGSNNVLIFYGIGNGTFENQTLYSMSYNSRPYSLAVGDLNDDNWMDIAVANYGTDYVEILLKTC